MFLDDIFCFVRFGIKFSIISVICSNITLKLADLCKCTRRRDGTTVFEALENHKVTKMSSTIDEKIGTEKSSFRRRPTAKDLTGLVARRGVKGTSPLGGGGSEERKKRRTEERKKGRKGDFNI